MTQIILVIIRRVLIVWLVWLSSITVAIAQQVDNPILVPVTYYGESFATSTGGRFQFGTELGAVTSTIYNSPPGAYFYSPVTTAYLEAGKDYQVNVTGSQVPFVTAHFSSVNGSTVFINGKEGRLVQQGINYTFTLRVETSADFSRTLDKKRGGEASSFPDDKAVWLIGLGKLRNGDFAGAVGIRSSSISYSAPNQTNPSSLTYSVPDNTGDVVITRDASNVIKSIRARDVAVVVDAYDSAHPDTVSYQIRCFTPSDFDAANFTSPFITYTIKRYTVGGVIGLQIDKLEDGATWSTIIHQNAAKTTWTKYDWRKNSTGAVDLSNPIVTTISGSTSTTTYGIADGTNPQLKKTKNFTTVNSRSELSSAQMGTSTVGTTLNYTYYTDTSGTGWPGAIKTMIDKDGSWTKYEYFNGLTDSRQGLKKVLYRPFGGAVTDPNMATLSNSYSETYDYGAASDQSNTAVTSKIIAINGTTVGKTTWSYLWSAGTVNGHAYSKTTESDYSATGSFLTTETNQISGIDPSPFFRDRPYSTIFADGTKSSYAYFSGTWSAGLFNASTGGNDYLVLEFHGQNASTSGAIQLSSWTWTQGTSQKWVMDPVYVFAGLSIVDAKVVDTYGHEAFSGKFIYTSSGTIEMISGTQRDYDSHNRLRKDKDLVRSVDGSNGEYATIYNYNAGLLTDITDPDGNKTAFEYDDNLRQNKRVLSANSSFSSDYPKRELQTTYYSSNLKKTEENENKVLFTYKYLDDGRVDSITEPQPGSTTAYITTAYSYPSGRKIVKTVKGDGQATGVDFGSEYRIDGRLLALTGTGQLNKYYNYSVQNGNLVEFEGDGSGPGNGWTEVTKDWLGRKIKERRPSWGYSAANSTRVVQRQFFYDSNTPNTLSKVATLDESASNARLCPDHLYVYGPLASLSKEGDDFDNNGTLDQNSSDRVILFYKNYYKEPAYNGWIKNEVEKRYDDMVAGTAPEVLVSDRRIRLTAFNNGAMYGSGRVYRDEVNIDESGRYSVLWEWSDSMARQVTRIEQLQGVTNTKISTWSDGYVTTVGSYNNNYQTLKYNSQGLVSNNSDQGSGGNVSTTYYSGTSYPNIITRISGVNNSTLMYSTDSYSYSWNGSARTVTIKDNLNNSVSNEYNGLGLVVKTWGSGTSPVKSDYDLFGRRLSITTYRDASLFQGSSWPSSPPSGDVTSFSPDPATGFVNTKTFPNSTTNTFSYKTFGQIYQYTNARNQVVTYNYFGSPGGNQSQLISGVSYDGGATTVRSYTYNRAGKLRTVSDVVGTRTLQYRTDGKLDYEELPATWCGGASASKLTSGYSDSSLPGALNGYSFNGNGQIFSETFLFDAAGRIGTIQGTGLSADLTVGYFDKTDVVSTIGGSPGFLRTMVVAPYTGSITSTKTSVNGVQKASFSQVLDFDRGLVCGLSRGSILDDAVGGWSSYLGLGQGYFLGSSTPSSNSRISYNSRGMLESLPSFSWTGTAGDTSAGTARVSSWVYDGNGNRTSEGGARASSYSMSDNVTNRAYGALNQYSSVTGVNAEAVMAYDNDGNLTQDGTWSYSYDRENRLTQMSTATKSFEFSYDYLGRRVWKRYQESGVTKQEERYLWNGMRLIAALNVSGGVPSLTKRFLWGPDISGTGSSAAGAGGLLAEVLYGQTYYTIVDTYGSVMGYVDGGGTIAAAWDYDAYGRILTSNGNQSDFLFGYACQQLDRIVVNGSVTTGHIYYGARYYNSKHGRFINRDPIGELGGQNLYSWCRNRGLNGHDWNGWIGSDDDITTLSPFEVTNDDTSVDPFYGFQHSSWSAQNAFSLGFNQGGYNSGLPGFTAGIGRLDDNSSYRSQLDEALKKSRERVGTANKARIAMISSMLKSGKISRQEAESMVISLLFDDLMQQAVENLIASNSNIGSATVYYWSPSKGYGHISIKLSNGLYISNWPKDDMKHPFGGGTTRTPDYELDKAGEANREPQSRVISGLDIKKITAWWSSRSPENGYSGLGENCSATVAEALQIGGFKGLEEQFIYSPKNTWNNIVNVLDGTKSETSLGDLPPVGP